MKFVNAEATVGTGRTINLEEDILVVDKPSGWTSHDVVAKVRGELGGKVKVGHGGTLDPFATGVLLILIGKAVKRFEEIKQWEKEYVMEVKLGVATDTGDRTGKIVETTEVGEVKKQKVEKVLKSFEGEYMQKVPRYAAVKVKGERMYKLARQGKKIKQPKRKVKIKEIELIKFKVTKLKELRVRVVCGSGTYMRQLAIDIGEKLGLAAHAKELRRTRVGKYLL